MATREATFIFLRSLPRGPTPTSLASPLQTIETSFLLVALQRFPHALSTCASAIEAIIMASPSGKSAGQGIKKRISAARMESAAIAGFPQAALDAFWKVRH
jgi:hypothetical protein